MSERLYSLILQLYPRPFRERYAEEMMRVFCGRLRDEGAARVWLDVLVDAVISIPRQHIVQEPHRYYPLAAAPLRAADAVRRQVALVSVLAGVASGLLGVATFFFGFSKTWPLAALLLVAWCLTARKACRTFKALKTVRAEASADAVTVAYAGVAPLTLRRSEVVGLHEFFATSIGGVPVGPIGLRIETGEPSRDLWVPMQAAAYPSVKARLSEWLPVKATPDVYGRALTVLHVMVLYLLALFLRPTWIGIAYGFLCFLSEITRTDLAAHRKLLRLGPIATIVLVRWLW